MNTGEHVKILRAWFAKNQLVICNIHHESIRGISLTETLADIVDLFSNTFEDEEVTTEIPTETIARLSRMSQVP